MARRLFHLDQSFYEVPSSHLSFILLILVSAFRSSFVPADSLNSFSHIPIQRNSFLSLTLDV